MIQLVRLRVVGKKQIGPAIVVVVEHGNSKCFGSRFAESGFLRHIRESSISIVVPQPHRSSFVRFRRAIRFALAVHGAIKIRFWRPLHIVSDDQIEFAVLVVVNPSSAGAEFFHAAETRLLRHISKCSVAVVVKQPALSVRSDENIVVAVVVVVADGYADAVHFNVETGFVRNVSKSAVVIVVIKLRRGVFLPVARPVGSVHQENIRPPVVVAVDEGNPRAHRLRQKLFAKSSVVVDEMNSGFCGDIFKRDA